MTKKTTITVGLLGVLLSTAALAQEPLVFEAEAGSAGADWTEQTEGETTYLTISTNGIANHPETAARVATYTLTFPASGSYELYARVRVGEGGAEDDSFFYGSAFGSPTLTDAEAWTRVNNIATGGFTNTGEVVSGGGSASSQVWKWINLSQFNGDETPVTFTVPEGALEQTLQIGGREDGLDFDKFAFGQAGLYYTVGNLDRGQAGSETPPDGGDTLQPIATGQNKWLGCVYSNAQTYQFANYWNQVTPENAGKWGSVEATRDQYNWAQLDEAYAFAQENGFPFRFHVLLWGAQQPAWIEDLAPEEQLEEIIEWMDTVAARYPDCAYVEVVNEPLNDPPVGEGNGDYLEALGGTGATGYDWIITAFELARARFPDAKLMINEYNIVSSSSRAAEYKQVIELLQARNLIDGIGVQSHAFSTGGAADGIKAILDSLGSTGLPIQATEMDIDGPTDGKQLLDYRKIFPIFWNHPSVEGITLWGFRPGLWRNDEMAYLITPEGEERPSLVWLRDFVNNGGVIDDVLVASIVLNSQSGAYAILTKGGTLQMVATVNPENATDPTVTWSLSNDSVASIDQNGLITALKNGSVRVTVTANDMTATSASRDIFVTNQEEVVSSLDERADWVKVFPNPSSGGSLHIQAESLITALEVMDLRGVTLWQQDGQHQNRLHLQLPLPAGSYWLQLQSQDKNQLVRIVIR